ncbi:MAG: TetR/AcrR family transcriptional regulator [Aeromicrobium sp.]|uniref:TetR/AcrR family transcriptional regulator n=1 Tax=Aeromicrobium sp. TaxID=1871063 RepID=UPI0039E695F6
MSTARAPRGSLTRDRVVAEAMALADAEGLSALTMRALAARLGVKPMAIYHHIASKEAILDAVIDQVFAEMDLPEPGRPWREQLRRRTSSVRVVLRRHGWSIAVLESRAVSTRPASLRHHDAVIGTLRRDGFDVAEAAHAFALLDSYVYGFVIQEVTLSSRSPQEFAEEVETLAEELDSAAYPYLTEMAVDHVMRPGYDFADEFDHGLELILDAIERDRAGSGG